MTSILTHKFGNLPVPTLVSCPLTAAGVVQAGDMIAKVTADGYWDVATTTTGFVAGVATQDVDNTAGADGAKSVLVEPGVFARYNSTSTDEITAAHLYQPCFVVDKLTVALTSASGSRPMAGIIMGVEANGMVRVLLGARVSDGVSIKKRSLALGHAALTAAATTQTLSIGAPLPANARILGVSITASEAFAGITGPVTIDIGTSGDVDALIDGANVTTLVDGQASTRPLGIAPNALFVDAEQLTATVLSASGNLVDLTAGAAVIDVLYIEMA